MEDWKKRLHIELHELEDRILRLQLFIEAPSYQELDADDKQLLSQQLEHMEQYATVLKLRIKRM